MEEVLNTITPALATFLVALFIYGRKKLENSVDAKIENGVESRLDKIEVGVWQNTKRLTSLEESINGGAGQHFTPPRRVKESDELSVDANGAPMPYIVPGTQTESR